jgi:hypothetical protein
MVDPWDPSGLLDLERSKALWRLGQLDLSALWALEL